MFHLQRPVTNWPDAIIRLPDKSLVKAIDRGDMLRDVKKINPDIKTVLRHYGGSQNIFGGTFEQNKQRARDFFSTFIDGTFKTEYAQYVDIVLEWNEYLASSHTGAELQDRINWARAVAEVWRDEYRVQPEYSHIRLGLLSCPVGNDIHRAFSEIALEFDAVISYHAYDKFINGQRDPFSWRYHCGRWNFMEQEWGLKPDWMFGESGPYGGVLEGWRHSKVLGGNRDRYVSAVRTWIREIQQTDAYKEGRVLGFNLFTTGRAGDTWKYYWTEQPELNMLAEMIKEEWKPGEKPLPDKRTYHKTAHLVRQDIPRGEYDRIMDEAWPNKNSVFFSADDWALTLVSDSVEVTGRTLIVWDVDKVLNRPEEEAKNALEQWVSTYYPNPKPTIIYKKVADFDFF